MRWPVDPLPPIETSKPMDIFELNEVAAAAAARRVAARTLPPLVSHPKPAPGKAPGEGDAGEDASAPTERRQGGDRRLVCRRIAKSDGYLFDTRSEGDRRKGPRRAADQPGHIDEEV